jgi:hypothetical protein
MKKAAEAALNDIYLAFSKSTGEQARRVMRAAVIAVCDKHKKPDLPIFGIDKDSIRVGIYGVDDKLPENLAARTPGEMHYVTCVEAERRTVDRNSHAVGLSFPSGGTVVVPFLQYRIQILWNVSLRKSDTAEEYDKKTLEGGSPPPFPENRNEWGNGYYEGSPPEIYKLVEWLEEVIK